MSLKIPLLVLYFNSQKLRAYMFFRLTVVLIKMMKINNVENKVLFSWRPRSILVDKLAKYGSVESLQQLFFI